MTKTVFGRLGSSMLAWTRLPAVVSNPTGPRTQRHDSPGGASAGALVGGSSRAAPRCLCRTIAVGGTSGTTSTGGSAGSATVTSSLQQRADDDGRPDRRPRPGCTARSTTTRVRSGREFPAITAIRSGRTASSTKLRAGDDHCRYSTDASARSRRTIRIARRAAASTAPAPPERLRFGCCTGRTSMGRNGRAHRGFCSVDQLDASRRAALHEDHRLQQRLR